MHSRFSQIQEEGGEEKMAQVETLEVEAKAMDEEIYSIERNETWELTELPPKKKAIGVKWVYKTKCNVKGKIDRHKARLVLKGYKQ